MAELTAVSSRKGRAIATFLNFYVLHGGQPLRFDLVQELYGARPVIARSHGRSRPGRRSYTLCVGTATL